MTAAVEIGIKIHEILGWIYDAPTHDERVTRANNAIGAHTGVVRTALKDATFGLRYGTSSSVVHDGIAINMRYDVVLTKEDV